MDLDSLAFLPWLLYFMHKQRHQELFPGSWLKQIYTVHIGKTLHKPSLSIEAQELRTEHPQAELSQRPQSTKRVPAMEH